MDFNTEMKVLEKKEISSEEAFEAIKHFQNEDILTDPIGKIQTTELLKILEMKMALNDNHS